MTHQEKDELIIATILNAKEALSPARKFVPTMGRRTYRFGSACTYGADKEVGPCCAIGAGLLYAGLKVSDRQAANAFAEAYGVSHDYAIGISDGFEGYACSDPYTQQTSADYLRGVAVGEAIYDAAFGGS